MDRTNAAGPWIVDRRTDLALIFGGALLTLAVPPIAWARPAWVPAMYWIWLLAFDGTHVWATYSRTYLDREFWRTDRPLLVGSLLVFVPPALAVAILLATGGDWAVGAVLAFVPVWSIYHNVRQHYGYVSLYDRKGGTAEATHRVHKWVLYLGLYAPFIHYVLVNPANRIVAGRAPAPTGWIGAIETWAPVAASAAAALWLATHHVGLRRRGASSAWASLAFVGSCLVAYSALYYGWSRGEPYFAGARTATQQSMVVVMAATIFHNLQYHAVVWHYNRRRYAGGSGEARRRHGLAASLNRNLATYLAAAAAFAATAYAAGAWFTTDVPSIRGWTPEPAVVPVAFIAWWGLSFHHFYLDQKIWRVSKRKDLQEHLGVDA